MINRDKYDMDNHVRFMVFQGCIIWSRLCVPYCPRYDKYCLEQLMQVCNLWIWSDFSALMAKQFSRQNMKYSVKMRFTWYFGSVTLGARQSHKRSRFEVQCLMLMLFNNSQNQDQSILSWLSLWLMMRCEQGSYLISRAILCNESLVIFFLQSSVRFGGFFLFLPRALLTKAAISGLGRATLGASKNQFSSTSITIGRGWANVLVIRAGETTQGLEEEKLGRVELRSQVFLSGTITMSLQLILQTPVSKPLPTPQQQRASISRRQGLQQLYELYSLQKKMLSLIMFLFKQQLQHESNRLTPLYCSSDQFLYYYLGPLRSLTKMSLLKYHQKMKIMGPACSLIIFAVFICQSNMSLQLNWKLIVVKVESSHSKQAIKLKAQEKQRIRRNRSQLDSQDSLKESICKRIHQLRIQEKGKIDEEMKRQRQRNQAIRAARIQKQSQLRLHSQSIKNQHQLIQCSSDFIKGKELNHRISSMKHQISTLQAQEHSLSGFKQLKKGNKDHGRKRIVSMFSQKPQLKIREKDEANVHLQGLDQRGSKERLNQQLRISINTKTEQSEAVSFPEGEYLSSSSHCLPQQSIRKLLKGYLSDQKTQLQNLNRPLILTPAYFQRKHAMQKKILLKNIQADFFKEKVAQFQVKGQQKKLLESASNKKLVRISRSKSKERSEYSNLLNGQFP